MDKVVAIVGGGGFVGRALISSLERRGYAARVVSRRPRKINGRSPEWVVYDSNNEESLRHALAGSCAVVNLVGILNTRMLYARDFHTAHIEMVEQILRACDANHIGRYLHMSALHADTDGASKYLRTKGEGDRIAHSREDIQTTSFYPSVIFGMGDSFLNRFASLLKFAPPIFPLACAGALFAPVYVNDVADRMTHSLMAGEAEKGVQLCGPEQYTLGEIVKYVASLINRNIKVIPLPDIMAKVQACALGCLPGKPFSLDNYYSLQTDSVCDGSARLCETRLQDVGHLCLGDGK